MWYVHGIDVAAAEFGVVAGWLRSAAAYDEARLPDLGSSHSIFVLLWETANVMSRGIRHRRTSEDVRSLLLQHLQHLQLSKCTISFGCRAVSSEMSCIDGSLWIQL